MSDGVMGRGGRGGFRVAVCVCVRVHVHVYICACACVHVYICACACVHMCVCACVRAVYAVRYTTVSVQLSSAQLDSCFLFYSPLLNILYVL